MATLLLSLAAPTALAQAPGPVIADLPLTPLRNDLGASEQPRIAVSVLNPPFGTLCPTWWPYTIHAGFSTGEATIVDALAFRESRCQPDAWNKQDPGTGSRGLMQINSSWHGWLRRAGIIETPEDLFDPETNLRATRQIIEYGVERYGWGFYPWGLKP